MYTLYIYAYWNGAVLFGKFHKYESEKRLGKFKLDEKWANYGNI